MDPHQEYQKALSEGRQAWINDYSRSSADHFWKAFQVAPEGVWTEQRLLCLQSYVHFLKDRIIVSTKDYKNLGTDIVNNENEPNIFRATAALCLGGMHVNDKKDYEETAQCFRQCINFCDSASPEEKERVDKFVKLGDGPPGLRKLDEVFAYLNERASEHLRQMQSCEVEAPVGVQDLVRSPRYVYPRAMLVPIFGDIPSERMERRLAAVGATCDCCGVARDSTDQKSLLACSQCKMAYYCSKECQLQQWKRGGHKKACRKPREFHPEDIVRGFLDEKIVVLRLKRLVDGEDGDDSRKWEAYVASVDGESRLVVVEEAELHHLRPADIV